MTTMYLRGFTRADEVDEDGPIPFIIATEGRKADGIDLQMDRLNLDRFLANPVVMYGHDYWSRPPIGRALTDTVRVDGPTLRGSVEFDLDDEFAATVDRKYRRGFLNAVSVGFDVRGLDEETGVPDEWEMLEFSAVPIPLDADAVKDAGRMARAMAVGDLLSSPASAVDASKRDLIRDAIDSLQALLDAPGAERDADPEVARRSIEDRRRRLRLASV